MPEIIKIYGVPNESYFYQLHEPYGDGRTVHLTLTYYCESYCKECDGSECGEDSSEPLCFLLFRFIDYKLKGAAYYYE